MIPASLFPPTPEKVIAGIQLMFEQGIALGTTIATLVMEFTLGVLKFVV